MNFFENLNYSPENEIIEVLVKNNNVRVEKIISYGQASPKYFWYEQKENEWVIVIKGQAVLEFENNELVNLKEGDYLFIPAMKKHRVKSTLENEVTLWLAFFFN